METIDLIVNGFHHQASLHRAMSNRVNKTIVYYHGGGFIFGSKDDLPSHAIDHFTKAGFDLLCMDYPKAPEMKLPQICDFIEMQLLWFLDNHHIMNLSNDYILFGRSAGGYLALFLTKRMIEMNKKVPESVIVFYGYSTFEDAEFKKASDHYGRYPKMTFDDVKSAIEDIPLFVSDLRKRYPLYVYSRQKGNWLQLLGINDRTEEYTIDVEVSEFPKLFLAASQFDYDVSYKQSLLLQRKSKSGQLFTSSMSEHAFDQKASQESLDLYKKLIKWLKQ
jgi:acetyl esterase/lipase